MLYRAGLKFLRKTENWQNIVTSSFPYGKLCILITILSWKLYYIKENVNLKKKFQMFGIILNRFLEDFEY